MSSKDIKYLKSYYEKYPDKFIEDYLGVKLMWYQKVLIKLLDKNIARFDREVVNMSVNVEQKIQIYNPSIEYLDIIKTYEYKEVNEEINKINGTCIIHMIPKMDTYLSNDENDLIGYCDAMMCEIRVFDVDNKLYYKDERLFDNILINNVNVETRIYKDLSTMYMFGKPIKIIYGCNTLFVESN